MIFVSTQLSYTSEHQFVLSFVQIYSMQLELWCQNIDGTEEQTKQISLSSLQFHNRHIEIHLLTHYLWSFLQINKLTKEKELPQQRLQRNPELTEAALRSLPLHHADTLSTPINTGPIVLSDMSQYVRQCNQIRVHTCEHCYIEFDNKEEHVSHCERCATYKGFSIWYSSQMLTSLSMNTTKK